MLIVYNSTSGEVVDNTGKNSSWPEGPPDDLAYLNTDSRDIPRESLALLRLHDVDDEILVDRVLTNRHHVDISTGTVVIDSPYPKLTVDRETIPLDGTTAAVVTFTDALASGPITFDVNGKTITETFTNGAASIEVVTSTPGPIVVTVVEINASLTINREV